MFHVIPEQEDDEFTWPAVVRAASGKKGLSRKIVRLPALKLRKNDERDGVTNLRAVIKDSLFRVALIAGLATISLIMPTGKAEPSSAPIRLIKEISFVDYINSVEFSPDGRLLIGTSANAAVDGKRTALAVAWDARSWKRLHEWRDAFELGGFSRNGGQVLLLHERDRATLWNTRSWKPLRTFVTAGSANRRAVLSLDGKRIARCTGTVPDTDGFQSYFQVFDTQSGKPLTLPIKLRNLLSFAPDSRNLAYLDVDGYPEVQILDTSVKLPPVKTYARCIAFSRTGDVAVTGDRERIGLWQLRSRMQRLGYTVEGNTGADNLAMSGNGQLFAADTGTRVSIYNTATGVELAQIPKRNPDAVPAISFSPQGDQLVLAAGNAIQVWEIARKPQ